MIESLLIANRGEIACRIIRTARRLGIRTVAAYSEADANALHVREADDAVSIGPAPARESYLVADRLIAAAKSSGAEAVHPGYGFLSENADFADAVFAQGLIWVGPPSSAIRAMGRKDAAKTLMADAGVPITPGYLGDDQTPARLKREADAIGYPVLIKAVAGGGGKGMRKVARAADFAAALQSCQREAAASFGDDRVLVERYIARPRHIEVQVFGDRHGNVVHLFERDCSLQRRHQKVIEEAPAPDMDHATRAAVCAAAVQAARAVSYVGAGTVEFIADASAGLSADRIWFMEMNTRLQVEHPVTEMITGIDLVEWQLRIAAGEPLPLGQSEIRRDGHAIEARLYAENPTAGFLPSTGPLAHFRLPGDVRVDTGVEAGDHVSPYYDPMVAKLIAHAPTRRGAAARLAAACRQVEVWPVRTNAAFLARAVAHPDFIAGHVDTGFIESRFADLVPAADVPASALKVAAARRIERERRRRGRHDDPWISAIGFRLNAEPMVEVVLQTGSDRHVVNVDGPVDISRSVELDGQILVFADGEAYPFAESSAGSDRAGGSVSSGSIVSPMSGRIIAVATSIGAAVRKGEPLLTLEAMKMEHTLTAPFDGLVAELTAVVGDQVSEATALVRLDPSI